VIYALIGAVIMLVVLVGIGINQQRGTSIKTWCYGYLAISVVFDTLVILALINQNAPQYAPLTETLLSLSAGAATGLAIHVTHHISEEEKHSKNSETKS
jgi:surface polysaccharide O-acyltransferase-like enzyme